MAENTTPIALDFLSDPSAGVAGLKQIELALDRVAKRVDLTQKAFAGLSNSISSSLAAKIAAVATATQRMGTGAQATTAAAASLATALAAVTGAQGGLAALSAQAASMAASMASAARSSTALRANAGGSGAGGAGGGGGGTGGAGGGGSMMAVAGRSIGGLLAGASIVAGIKQATSAAMDFEQAMAGVAAVGEIDKTSEAFARLTVAAKSGSSAFTSKEKAEGLREIVAAGRSADEAARELGPTLQLAVAGEMGMGRAAEIMTSSMAAFGVESKNAVRVVDVLATAANSSLASIDSMGEAMKFAAPIANGLEISLEDTAAAISLLAKYGVQGGMAGRGFGAIMARLVAPSREAADAIAEAGLTIDQLNPQIAGMGNALAALGGISQETLVKLFGAENLDVSNIFAKNAEELESFQAAMSKAEGAGARFANTIADTTSGKLKAFKNQLTEVSAEVGKLGTSLLAVLGTKLEGSILDPSMIASGLQAGAIPSAPNTNLVVDTFKARLAGASGEDEVNKIMQEMVARRNQANRDLDAMQPGGTPGIAGIFGASEEDLQKTADLVNKLAALRTQAVQIFLDGRNKREAAEKASADRASMGDAMTRFAGAFSFEPFREQGPPADALSARKMGERVGMSPDEIEKAADAAEKILPRAAKLQEELDERRKSAVAAIAVEEAKASGNTAMADRLQKELDIMREKKRLVEELSITDEAAGDLASRLVNARAKSSAGAYNGVASSLQQIGGGGGFHAGASSRDNVQDRQLAVQEQIRDGINALKGGNVIQASIQ